MDLVNKILEGQDVRSAISESAEDYLKVGNKIAKDAKQKLAALGFDVFGVFFEADLNASTVQYNFYFPQTEENLNLYKKVSKQIPEILSHPDYSRRTYFKLAKDYHQYTDDKGVTHSVKETLCRVEIDWTK